MENQSQEKIPNQKPNSDTKKSKRVRKSILDKQYLTPVGNRIHVVYKLEYNEKLRQELAVPDGEEDIDKFIQSSSSTTDMAFLQREARRTGQYPVDPSAQYGVDATLMPTNIHELYKTTSDIKKFYDRLGDTGKAAFGSLDAYKTAVIAGTAEDILRSHYKKLAEEEILKQKQLKDKKDKE